MKQLHVKTVELAKPNGSFYRFVVVRLGRMGREYELALNPEEADTLARRLLAAAASSRVEASWWKSATSPSSPRTR